MRSSVTTVNAIKINRNNQRQAVKAPINVGNRDRVRYYWLQARETRELLAYIYEIGMCAPKYQK